MLYGATTGRDGIGGASVLASQELGEDDADKRPSVQVGDPFTGKKLIEVSVELVEGGLVESLQDCGAAGLASSLSEMAGEAGIDVHLDRVPLREDGMEPWEIMISESQERMVAVVRPQMLDAVRAVCARWELPCTPVGTVTEHGELRAFWSDEVVGSIPARLLTDECPRYEVEQSKPDAWPAAPKRLSDANRADKTWITEQYDQLVGSRTVRRPGSTPASCACGRRCVASPSRSRGRGPARRIRSARASRRCSARRATSRVQAASRSGSPTASTSAIPRSRRSRTSSRRRSKGSRRLPRHSGSRSSPGTSRSTTTATARSIPPTPVVGCVGLVADVRLVPGGWQSGDVVLLAEAPEDSLAAEAALIRFLWKAAPLLSLCHDIGYGGLEVALAEAETWSGCAADVELPAEPARGAAILAASPDDVSRLGSKGFVEIGRVR